MDYYTPYVVAAIIMCIFLLMVPFVNLLALFGLILCLLALPFAASFDLYHVLTVVDGKETKKD